MYPIFFRRVVEKKKILLIGLTMINSKDAEKIAMEFIIDGQ
jgi:hypothetical protein